MSYEGIGDGKLCVIQLTNHISTIGIVDYSPTITTENRLNILKNLLAESKERIFSIENDGKKYHIGYELKQEFTVYKLKVCLQSGDIYSVFQEKISNY